VISNKEADRNFLEFTPQYIYIHTCDSTSLTGSFTRTISHRDKTCLEFPISFINNLGIVRYWSLLGEQPTAFWWLNYQKRKPRHSNKSK